jgi:peptide deformylase
MRILTIEDKKDAKFLAQKTSPVDLTKFTKAELRTLIREMRQTMRASDGVGLSANQVGFDMQFFVAEIPTGKNNETKFYAIFNAKITKTAGDTELEEGCLSVPLTYGGVKRPERITLEGNDMQGRKIKIKAWGFLARVFQHEVDHLNGHLFTEKARDVHTIAMTDGHNHNKIQKSSS